MNTTEINFAIAEACGWDVKGKIPDFCNDLNAMAVVQTMLTDSEEAEYDAELDIRVCLTPGAFVWQATARQRAEAFLRVIGKWKDDPGSGIDAAEYRMEDR